MAATETAPTIAEKMARSIADTPEHRRYYETSSSAPAIAPAAMAAAGRHVEREYGCTGYTMAAVGGNATVGCFRVRYCDGSEFLIVADAWENVARIPD